MANLAAKPRFRSSVPSECSVARAFRIAWRATEKSAYAVGNSDVHCGQRVAPIGMLDLQYGQSFLGAGVDVTGVGSRRFIQRMTMKITNATMTKSSTVLMKTRRC